jgi:hypothetical protein
MIRWIVGSSLKFRLLVLIIDSSPAIGAGRGSRRGRGYAVSPGDEGP